MLEIILPSQFWAAGGPQRALALADTLVRQGVDATGAADLAAALPQADVVTCATTSTEPLVKGALLRPGTHVDLVGAFTPQMRESDDDAVLRSRVFVNTYAGAPAEAGDLLQPSPPEAGAPTGSAAISMN